MPAVEVRSTRGRERVVNLVEPTYVIGSDPEAATIVIDDSTTSGVHAALDRIGTAWLLRDLGSRNGTFVDGERLTGQTRLRDGQQISLGRTYWLVFCDGTRGARRATDPLTAPPRNITRTEQRVLVELCRPKLAHNAFQEPASVREIAARLGVGKGAIEAHLTNLYDKFAIHPGEGVNRRVSLAEEAMRRGAVTLGDLGGDAPSG
jgi:hypothetical protein